MNTYSNKTTAYTIKVKTFKNKKYIVVPVIMMKEGVHSGSQGPLLHTAEELGKCTACWNGIPIVVHHPEVEGNSVSANDPEVLTSYQIGIVFNTKMDDDKLKAEAWIDEAVAKAKFPLVLAYINQGKALDVSVGVFPDEVEESGEWNGEQYIGIATNLRPDHLALLPGERGACSWSDGCGIRTNKNKSDEMNTEELTTDKKEGNHLIVNITTYIKMGYQELMSRLYRMVDALDIRSQDRTIESNNLEEVYDGYIVYRKNFYTSPSTQSKYYQQNYTVDTNNEVSFEGDPIEVVRNLTYTKKNINNNKGGTKMERTKQPCSGCKEDKVDRIIANKASGFTEEDREILNNMEETVLEKMLPVEVKEPITVNKEKGGITPEEAIDLLTNSFKTTEDYLKIVPEEVREQIQTGLTLNKERRTQLIQSIVNNAAKDSITAAELETYSLPELEKFNKAFVRKVVDFSGNGGESIITNAGEENDIPILLPV
jgi:hypothetical protein